MRFRRFRYDVPTPGGPMPDRPTPEPGPGPLALLAGDLLNPSLPERLRARLDDRGRQGPEGIYVRLDDPDKGGSSYPQPRGTLRLNPGSRLTIEANF